MRGAGPRSPLRQPFAPSDAFHWLLDRAIRRGGGPGNVAQLRVRLAAPPADRVALAAAWTRLGTLAPPLAARPRFRPLRAGWEIGARARLALVESGQGVEALALAELRRGLRPERGEHVRLSLAADPADAGVVLTWNHRLLDARGALGLLAALPDLARGAALGEPWWRPDYREPVPRLPAAERGRQARRSLDFVRPLRRRALLSPITGRAPAAPLATRCESLGAETAACDARIRAAAGRFGETPFLLACIAGALEALLGVGGDLVFPLAADLRAPQAPRRLANAHGFLLLRLEAGVATADLGRAARALRDDHRRWVAEDGVGALLAALSWAPLVGERLALAELGAGRSGVAASCVVANAGRTAMPGSFFGAEVVGVDHVAAVPGRPGLGVLFHRDRRGLGFGLVATAVAQRRVPLARFSAELRHQLLVRPFAAAAP